MLCMSGLLQMGKFMILTNNIILFKLSKATNKIKEVRRDE